MLHLHDTALGRVVEFRPREEGKVSMYVCGPTVYDVPHLGHGRFSLVFDVLRRYLEWRGLDVTYVSNITDVDDKILARAAEQGRTPADLAQEYEGVWYDAMDRLGVKRPSADPHATAFVDRMIEVTAELIDRGKAYETDHGVYFMAEAVEDYGLLARQSLESLRSGARIEVDEDKRSPMDFALWKKAAPGEQAWDSPWGPGRPGWHTECVVMSLDLLDDAFDIHGGGLDLSFPHHENERAQAVALGRRFATHWVHNGFVEAEGEKMSKSLGNYTSLVDLLDAHDARSYRLLVLRSHYRSPMEVSPASLADADAALARLDAFARRTAGLAHGGGAAEGGAVAPDEAVVERFRAAMDDDLDTPRAVALLFEEVRAGNSALDGGDTDAAAVHAATVAEIAGAMGLEPQASAGDELPGEVADMARRRDEARAARDFAEADRLRDALQSMGWTVEDTPDGTLVRR